MLVVRPATLFQVEVPGQTQNSRPEAAKAAHSFSKG